MNTETVNEFIDLIKLKGFPLVPFQELHEMTDANELLVEFFGMPALEDEEMEDFLELSNQLTSCYNAFISVGIPHTIYTDKGTFTLGVNDAKDSLCAFYSDIGKIEVLTDGNYRFENKIFDNIFIIIENHENS